MSNIFKGLNENRDSWDSNMPGYKGDYGGAENWGRRNKASDENDAIDARLRQQHAQKQEYEKSGKFWLKLKDSQRHLPAGPFIGKQAANAAALELLKQQPELKGNLLITAYGPDETKNVAEAEQVDSPKFQSAVSALKQMAKEGPRKTVWDPVKRVYKTVPVNTPKKEEGVAEGSLNEGQYEMMMRNGQVKKFVAKDDADAKRIAAGHGAKSVIRLRGGVPAGKVSEQGVAEGVDPATYPARAKEAHEKYLKYENLVDQELRKFGQRLPKAWDAARMMTKLSSDPKYALALKYYKLSEKFASLAIWYEDLAKKRQGVAEEQVDENLRKWFKEKWVRFGPDGKIRGACARGDDSEGKPKCLPQAKAHALGKKGRKYAASKKRREDPNPERRGPAKNVATKKKSNEGAFDNASPTTKETMLQDKINSLKNLIAIAKEQGRGVRVQELELALNKLQDKLDEACWKGYHKEGMKTMFGKKYPNCVKNTNEEQDVQEAQQCPECGGPMFSELLINEKKDACYYKVKSRYKVWPSAYASGALVQCRKKGASNWGTKSESVSESENFEESFDMKINELDMVNEDWQKANRNDKTSGMSRKAVKAYRRENPGSKLQTAVTTKPSKLKKGSKAAKRRKSFCARMKGMKKNRTSAKTARDPNSNINKALRRWNCESIEQMQELVMIAEAKIAEAKNAKQQAAIAIAKKAAKKG